MELSLEIEGLGVQPGLPGGGASLVAFMSFAVVRGFGADHPLIRLADQLHAQHEVRLGRLSNFYEGRIDDDEDAEMLEMTWQRAGPLRESLRAMTAVFERGENGILGLLREAGAEDLPGQVAALDAALEP